ncbi:MAG: peptidase MA family metallohydrolase [Dehalococcoidales bacterium]|nr:peptidase MA family metallohydrolase [Dehalococcoidales bacterium]
MCRRYRAIKTLRLAPIALLIAFLVTGGAAFAAPVAAPASGIEASAPTQKNEFPTQVVFTLHAQSGADIVKATLSFKQAGQATTTISHPEFAPAKEVDLRYVWDLQRYYSPPGVNIEYYWLLEDAAGQKLRTDPTTFALDDVRFTWQEVNDGPVHIYWYEGDQAFAAKLLDAGKGALDQLSQDAGVETDLPLKVFIYANQKDLLGGLQPSAQEWAGGTAFPDERVVVAAVEPTSSGLDYGLRVLPHELSHVVVYAMTKNPYGDIPRWLDEGLAMYAEGELESGYKDALNEAIRLNGLISVQSLSANFPSDPRAAYLSYAQSYSLVKYLIGQYGSDGLAKLLANFKEGATYDGALQATFGVDTEGLDAAWRQSAGAQAAPALVAATPQPPSQPALSASDLRAIVVALAIGAFVVFLLVRRRRQA